MTPDELVKRMNKGIEYRSMTMEIRKSEETDKDSFIVEGYASTFDEEYTLGENDQFRLIEKVDRNAFNEADESDVIFQYDHEGRVFARTSNGTLELENDEHGKKIVANLGGTEIGRQLYQEIKGGYTNKMSFGFTVEEWKEEERKGADGKLEVIQTVARIGKLYDVSAVSIPANSGTAISARNRFNAEVEKRMAEATEKEAEEKAAEELRAKEEAEKLEKEKQERERLALELEFSLSL